MKQPISTAPVLSPVNGKPVLMNFDGALMSSDAGLALLREVERRHDLAGLLASCLTDQRDPGKVRHSLDDIIRFRMMMIAAGYEDGNDAADLRHDPSFKIALERNPQTGAALCSQPTISRMENLPEMRDLIRMGRAMVRFYCLSFAQVPGQIVLDIDDTFDAVHGHQQLRLFNAYYDEYGFQPIVVFDGGGRLVGALLRPARRPKGAESAAHLRRLIREIRKYWPKTEILLRADSHYCTPQVLDLCDQRGLNYVLGLSRNARLQKEVQALEASTAARYAHNTGHKVRRFKTFTYAAGSWSKTRRVVARVEVSSRGRDTRYIVTNLDGGRGKHLYEKIYSARGQAENHIKGWKTHLASDRTSCNKASANQMRLMLHGCAYWIWWTLRAACPKRSQWRNAQFDTLRLHLVKLAATIVEKKTRIVMTLPASCPRQSLLRLLLKTLAPPRPT
ncbi:IS1380 family transposase [Marivita sp. XM-24bin2]|uniref:IS1380 family transposase n=1 Tax=Marivita sp. XM-24bin2 TaxID=2133951 RepID=UPI000D7B0E3C|nr:IS1380 family transposase [Marivita sp. XM-24bin2]PWL29667.1 MAG: IS1380 family transposase [Marivita sp. XM-24bin2]